MPSNTKTYTFKEQIHGFPWTQVGIVAVIRFAEPVAFTSLFPYIYFMVKSFHEDQPDNVVARYAGYLSGIFALSQAFTGIIWGSMSDKYGRKPIILLGQLNTAFAMLMLGFSRSFMMAIAARIFGGLANGNVGVIRTVLGEIAVKRHHQPLAFITMPLLWQIGCIIGPMIGGYLAQPVKEHPSWFQDGAWLCKYKQLFSTYPFLLPNLVVATFLFCSVIFTFFFLEETHILKRKRKAVKETDLDETQPLLGSDTPVIPSTNEAAEQQLQDEQLLLALEDEGLHEWGRILVPRVQRLLVATFVNSLQATVYEELLPIFLCANIIWSPGDSLRGGLGFSAGDMGTVLSSNGVIGVCSMLLFFPWLERNYGAVRPVKIASKLIPLASFVCPFYILLLNYSPTVRIVTVTLCSCLRHLAQGVCYPALLLLMNQAAMHPLHLGTINGCNLVVSAAARALGPIVWGYLMDKGQSVGHVEIPWWCLTGFALFGAYQINAIKGSDYGERE